MECDVEVRLCTSADVAVIAATESPGADVARRQFDRQQRGESAYLVAWWDEEPVGSAELLWNDPPELSNLHVVAVARGRGIGSAILRAAEERCGFRGRLTIRVGLDNLDARRLYERLGFVGTGELTTSTYRYVDSVGEHEATETDERLVKTLIDSSPSP